MRRWSYVQSSYIMRKLNNWPCGGLVRVPTSREAAQQLGDEGYEKRVVAVLRVKPDRPCRVGYVCGKLMQYFQGRPITADGLLGMRLGDQPVSFFVIAEDLETDVGLELVEFAFEEDPKYESLPVY